MIGSERHTVRLRLGAVAVAFGALAIASCSSSTKTKSSTGTTVKGQGVKTVGLFPPDAFNAAQNTGTPVKGGSLTYGLEAAVGSLTPGVIAQPSEFLVGAALYDPLVGYDSKGKIAPTGLASGWKSSPDLKTWTFTLRPGVTFTDGTPVNAAAVVTQIEAQKALPTCQCAANFTHIHAVKATGALTVEFDLDQANVAFPTSHTAGNGYLAAPAAWAAGAASMTSAPIGSGPFKSLAKGQLSFVRNPTYWRKSSSGQQLPYLDKITFVPLADSSSRLPAIRAGQVDVFQTADTSNLVQAKKDASLVVQPITGSSSTVIVLNSHIAPFNDIRLRQAYNYALDRDTLNTQYYGGTRQPAYGPLPPSNPYYDPAGQLPKYDPAAAKKLVAALKADGKPTSWTGICITSPEATADFAIIKKMDDAVGLTSSLHVVDQVTLVNTLLSPNANFQQACFRNPQVGDPDDLYATYYKGGGNNTAKLWDPILDEALRAGRKSTDDATRRRAYNTVQERIAADVVIVPLLFDLYGNVHTKSVSGLSQPVPSSLGLIDPAVLYLINK